TIALLKDASSKARSDAVKNILQKAINNLSFTEIYSPILGKIKDDDRVACNLLGGLVL
uniref:Uncharacterized protein n=1 Tax=Romanomermis culicivorax TaxID=13658 RepID=A0A915I702_ROMCU